MTVVLNVESWEVDMTAIYECCVALGWRLLCSAIHEPRCGVVCVSQTWE
jgi:hypothetical protein